MGELTVWPFVFKRLNIKKLKIFIIIAIVLLSLIRIFLYIKTPFKKVEGIMYDSILIGALGAILEIQNIFFKKLLNILDRNGIAIAVIIFLFVISPILNNSYRESYGIVFGILLNSIAIMYLIFYTINIDSLLKKILNLKMVSQIGIISYSLYIWQQLIFVETVKSNKFNTFPINFIIVFAIAFISFYLYEKPIMALKKKRK